ATRAKKRLHGTWCRFAKAAEAATDAAAVVFYLTLRDAETLQRDAPDGQKLLHLSPFLPLETLPPAAQLEGPMLSVGMMRAGDKLASYRIIAEVLAQLPQGGWRLQIAGDGPARADVTALMAPFGEAVTFLGRLDRTALAETYQNAQLMLWPGVNEAFGMAYLEAQAHGVPVIAQDRPGVREVLAPGNHPTVDAGAPGLTARVQALLSDVKTRHAAGAAARAHVAAHHLAPHARETLQRGLEHVGVRP
ncbi:MAG: glycosyltransferase, partial [Pseudomonadota bacterium]